jgi:hypothetical protein
MHSAYTSFVFQKFPGNLLPGTFYDSENVEVIRGRSELERREQYIEALEGAVGYLHPSLVQLVKQCLHNAPHERPNADDLLARLQRMKAEVEGEYGGDVVKVDIKRIKLAKKVKDLTLQLVSVAQLLASTG